LTGQVLCDTLAIPTSQLEIIAGVNSGRKATADADGRYSFAGLAAGALTLRASATGYLAQTTNLVIDGNKTADFKLVEAAKESDRATLSGVVLSAVPGGTAPRPLSGARVSITSGNNSGRSATTDEQGRYRLDDLGQESATVEASANGHITDSRTIALDGSTTLDFRLAPSQSEPPVHVTGRVVDALKDTGLAGVTVKGDGLTAAPSDGGGAFNATASVSGPNPRPVSVSGPGIVDRLTHLPVPGQNLFVSLIPAAFDLPAFDQMFRDPGLRRWTAAPPIAIERRALQYTDVDMSEGVAVDDAMAETELQELISDLTWALPQLTGGTFSAFERVSHQSAETGARVTLLTPGQITVARVVGLEAATGRWGWGRWLYDDNGTVMGGIVMLDRDFERRATPSRRALRSHELGHALGYAHVSGRESVMNASGLTEPAPFDRDATRIAFQRKPGSRSPDVDPDPGRSVQRTGPPRWSEALH
jgi:hypothetical protein